LYLENERKNQTVNRQYMRTITTHRDSAFNTLSDIGAAGEKLKASIHNFRGIYLLA
jgi:hypothetical protein